MADKEWSAANDMVSGLAGGSFINETAAGDIEWRTLGGGYVNEEAGAVSGRIFTLAGIGGGLAGDGRGLAG